jgi:DNA-binding PadR family transcriptional regulator
MVGLSHHECHVLALVQKWQPTTAYFLRKALTQRLASDASDSPGSVYPVIERLKRAGLVQSEEGGAGRRKSEFLTCTEDGAAAVRHWMVEIDQSELLPSDPWRTRVPFIEALPVAERVAWFLTLRTAVSAELEKLERLREAATELPSQLELEHARLVTTARLAWINEAIALLASA